MHITVKGQRVSGAEEIYEVVEEKTTSKKNTKQPSGKEVNKSSKLGKSVSETSESGAESSAIEPTIAGEGEVDETEMEKTPAHKKKGRISKSRKKPAGETQDVLDDEDLEADIASAFSGLTLSNILVCAISVGAGVAVGYGLGYVANNILGVLL